jgi:hypothetical protein
MSTNEPDQGTPSKPPPSHAGTIVILGIVALGIIWTYIFFGSVVFGYWGKGIATVVIVPTMIWAWHWRQKRISRQLELLERWADAADARSRQKPAGRTKS